MKVKSKIIKRDERLAEFDPNKIYMAITKAFDDTYPKEVVGKYTQFIAETVFSIEERIDDMELLAISIEEIQELVVDELLSSPYQEVAVNYIQYKTKKAIQRIQKSDMEKQLQKLVERDVSIINENANKDSRVFNTQRDLTAGIAAKVIGLKMLPPHVSNAHEKGDIHFHDLDYSPYAPMSNCCLVDFKYMFENGFNIGNAEVEGPKSINTAAAQMAQIIANVASSQYGGTSADRVDELLSPYAEMNYAKHLETAEDWIEGTEKQIAYAQMKTLKDIYDAMQSLEYEVNTLYTSNGQTPFVTFGFGLGDNWFAREIQKAILAVRIKGLGKERRTAIFPKLVFSLKRGLNLEPTDPNYDIKQLALECSTKRMYPDVLMYDKLIELTGSFKAPMGCRSFLQGWKDENGEEVNSGRMNLGVVTLNLPRIALESAGNKDKFWHILEERLAVVKEALVYRLNRTKEAKPENAPILYMNGAWGHKLKADESVDELFKNKRATISMGYIGLYEVGTVFFGPEWEKDSEAKDFTLSILKKMKESTDAWGNQYGYHFSVYATPSESLTDRFCKMDKTLFGTVENITDKEYYTNSFHYDVRKNPNPFEKLDFEMDYPKYTSGGFIHYCEYPNLQQNPKALETVWDYAYDRVGYLGTNTPIDHCLECGFEGDFHPTERGFQCPECGNENPETCDVVKRTCGYLGNPQKRPMANGRHKEISARVKHMETFQNEDEEESDCSI